MRHYPSTISTMLIHSHNRYTYIVMKSSTYATNKRARFDYNLLSRFTAGLVLSGNETKSIRLGNASLKGSFVTISANGEAWLTNAHINPFVHGGPQTSYDPTQARKLLLSKAEIAQLAKARANKQVVVPVRLFASGRYIKLELAIAQPKRLHDKRRTIQKRDVERDERRNFKS